MRTTCGRLPRRRPYTIRRFTWAFAWFGACVCALGSGVKAAAGEILLDRDGGPVWALAVSPDGETIATAGHTDGTVRLWEARRGTLIATLKQHKSWVRSLDFAPDGKTLATGGGDQSVRIWDVESRQTRAVIEGYPNWIEGLAVSPDGRWLASAGAGNGNIFLHDLARGEVRYRLAGHSALVRGLAFSADGKTLASGSVDQTVKLWTMPEPGTSR